VKKQQTEHDEECAKVKRAYNKVIEMATKVIEIKKMPILILGKDCRKIKLVY
jgi:hypothetical protein